VIVTNFFTLLLSAGGRAPAAIVGRLSRAASALRRRRWRGRQQRVKRAPPFFLDSNHVRRDIGLPPVDSRGWPI
jgi:hypothetical protein